MFKVICIMGIGVVVGYLLRSKVITGTHKVIEWAIIGLLFLLGIYVGSSPEIINNLDTIGVDALIISLGAVGGSIFIAWLLFHVIFKKG